MARYNSLHDGQADTCALEFLRGMQSLEDAKELVRVAHVEAHAVIAHVVDAFPALT